MKLSNFVQNSLIRPVDSGYIEYDETNFIRFNYGLQKYVFNYMEQHPEIPVSPVLKVKKFYSYIIPHYFAGPIVTCTIGVINRRIGAMAVIAGIIAHRYSVGWAFTRANRTWQEYLLTNFKNFDPNVKEALETGDARYLKKIIDFEKSVEDMDKETRYHLLIK